MRKGNKMVKEIIALSGFLTAGAIVWMVYEDAANSKNWSPANMTMCCETSCENTCAKGLKPWSSGKSNWMIFNQYNDWGYCGPHCYLSNYYNSCWHHYVLGPSGKNTEADALNDAEWCEKSSQVECFTNGLVQLTCGGAAAREGYESYRRQQRNLYVE
jgi:hypothetical protein